MKCRKIEVRAGYYEWNIYVDDELFFTLDDGEDGITWDVTESGANADDFRLFCESYAYFVRDWSNDLSDDETKALENALFDAWAEHFNI